MAYGPYDDQPQYNPQQQPSYPPQQWQQPQYPPQQPQQQYPPQQWQQPQYPPQQPQYLPQQWQQPQYPLQQPYGQPPGMVVAPKSPGVALLLSLLIPGVGSIYAGNVALGVIILVLSVIADGLCLVVVGFFLAPIIWIWGMIAAYMDAQRWNRERGIIS